MVFDLRQHGFLDCKIDEDFGNIDANLPTWRNVSRITIKTFKDSIGEHLSAPITDSSGAKFLPLYEWGSKLDEGTYGKIYKAIRRLYYHVSEENYLPNDSKTENIVIKESPVHLSSEELLLPVDKRNKVIAEDIQTHIHEATVLTMAYLAVKGTPMEYSVPRVYEVFLHSNTPKIKDYTDIASVCIAMEYIHGRTMMHFLNNHFKPADITYNNSLFLHFLKQMAELLQILQTRLRMNHRDIKINNILIRDPENPLPKLVLIDYGFACIAKGEQEPDAEFSKIEAGSYFGSRFACFKVGRDLCQFIYSIHCYFPLEKFLSPELLALVRRWMTVKYTFGMADLLLGLNTYGRPSDVRLDKISFDEGIYLFLRRREVEPLQCAPEAILRDIEEYEKQPK